MWLGGCLLPAPAPVAPTPSSPIVATEVAFPQAALSSGAAWSGRMEGPCAGRTALEIRADSRVLTQAWGQGTDYLIYLPPGEDLLLRFGCDDDQDGVITDVQQVPLRPATTATVDLMLPLPAHADVVTLRVAGDVPLPTGAPTLPNGPILGPPDGAIAPPDGGTLPPLPPGQGFQP